MTTASSDDKIAALETAMWGPPRDPEAGLVRTIRRIEENQDAGRRQNVMILAGLVVAIVTPAATILLTRAAG